MQRKKKLKQQQKLIKLKENETVFFLLFLLTQNGSLPVAPSCKCFVDVGHCQVPLFIECRDVANAKTADPRRSSYKNLSKLMEKKKKRRDDQMGNIEPCGHPTWRGQTIRSHPHRCRCLSLFFHSLGAAAKIYISKAITIKDQMGKERERRTREYLVKTF